MPFCINCGSPVSEGDQICNVCGKSPWSLDSKSETEPKPRHAAEGLVSLIVLFAAILLIFGLIIWQLGISSNMAASSSSSSYPRSDSYEKTFGGPTEIMTNKPYHVYRTFNFGSFGFFVEIIGIIILIYTWIKIRENTKSIKILAIALSGVVFIIFALFIFIFGFDDLLTFTGGNISIKPTFTQQYAWIIETFVFGSIGILLWCQVLH